MPETRAARFLCLSVTARVSCFFYTSALFFSLCIRWESCPCLSTSSQLASFPEPSSRIPWRELIGSGWVRCPPWLINWLDQTRPQGFTSRREEGSFQRMGVMRWEDSPKCIQSLDLVLWGLCPRTLQTVIHLGKQF